MCVYMVRHGMTSQDHDGASFVSGWNGVGLTEEGRNNARRAGNWLKRHGVTELITSDIRRTRETAGIVSDITGIPTAESENLRSWNMGNLQGMKMELAEPFLDYFKRNKTSKIPGGEPRQTFDSRVAALKSAILSRARKFPNAKTAYFTHSQVMEEAFGATPKPGGILEIDVQGDRVSVRRVRVD